MRRYGRGRLETVRFEYQSQWRGVVVWFGCGEGSEERRFFEFDR